MGTASQVIDLLGLTKPKKGRDRGEADLIRSVKNGLPYRVIAEIQGRLQVSESEIAKAVLIQPRTLARRKLQKRLQMDESDRVCRLAALWARAVEVMEGEENARVWFKTSNLALGGVTPLEYSSTEMGSRRVEALVSQIEWGDPS